MFSKICSQVCTIRNKRCGNKCRPTDFSGGNGSCIIQLFIPQCCNLNLIVRIFYPRTYYSRPVYNTVLHYSYRMIRVIYNVHRKFITTCPHNNRPSNFYIIFSCSQFFKSHIRCFRRIQLRIRHATGEGFFIKTISSARAHK